MDILTKQLFEISETNDVDPILLEEYNAKKDDNIRKNILTMLKALFPSSFPVINDIGNSLDIVFDGSVKFKDVRFNPVAYLMNSYTKYSYLKIGSEVYTITNVTWLNDFLNQPRYRELLEKYEKFQAIQRSKKIYRKKDMTSSISPIQQFYKDNIKGEFVKFKITENDYLQNIGWIDD